MRRSAAAGVGPQAGESWQSQQQPGKAAAEGESKMDADKKKIAGGIHKTYQFEDAMVAILTESNLKGVRGSGKILNPFGSNCFQSSV